MTKSDNIVPMTLSSDHALRVIRELAADSSKIVITGHASARAKKRYVTHLQIEKCLQKGTITEGPFLNAYGHWQVSMYRHAAGEELTCAVAIEWAQKLVVVTVFPPKARPAESRKRR